MAHVFSGLTPCALCRNVINDSDEIVLFPPFIQNVKDPFFVLNDAVAHHDCLKKHELGDRALEYLEIIFFKTRPANRICAVSGASITDPEHYLFIDLLTSSVSERLNAFNFTSLDKRNLPSWQERAAFLQEARLFLANGKWESLGDFNYLDYLIRQMDV